MILHKKSDKTKKLVNNAFLNATFDNFKRIIDNIGIIGTNELISSNQWPEERNLGGLFDVLSNANLVRDKSHGSRGHS